jgi:cyclin-dependent kinase 12/13
MKRSRHRFTNTKFIAKGTYGKVSAADDADRSGERVVIKQIKLDSEDEYYEGSTREVSILRELNHPNIINLLDVAKGSSEKHELFLVFGQMRCDLRHLIEHMNISNAQAKTLIRQLLCALSHCHERKIMHRDIKPGNILLDQNGVLKLADFGLSRKISVTGRHTTKTITLWYRAPELLVAPKQPKTQYKTAVDIWSVGCIYAELLHPKQGALLPGENELNQLNLIWKVCGTHPRREWHTFYVQPAKEMPRDLARHIPRADRYEYGLIDKMLHLNPALRITAKDALLDDCFFRGTKSQPLNV